jgi:hypothetical protein
MSGVKAAGLILVGMFAAAAVIMGGTGMVRPFATK